MPRFSSQDIEFAVGDFYTHDFNDALRRAFYIAMSGRQAYLDVLIYSKAAAFRWGGDDAVGQYLEDPEASVFERFEIRVNNLGRIP